jgi:hypothetical protein
MHTEPSVARSEENVPTSAHPILQVIDFPQSRERSETSNRSFFEHQTSPRAASMAPSQKGVLCTYRGRVRPGLHLAPFFPENTSCFIPAAGSALDRYDAVICFDSEWVQRGDRNEMLSYQ